MKGNIGWYAGGKIPIRRTGDGAFPYDGSTDEGDWVGFIPFDELPNLYDPPNGLIVTANQRTVGLSYKYTQFRARRGSTVAGQAAYGTALALKHESPLTMCVQRSSMCSTYRSTILRNR